MKKLELRKTRITLIVLAIAGISVAGYTYFSRGMMQPPAENPAIQHKPDQLAFPPGASQLAYIKTSQAVSAMLPASEPLAAKLPWQKILLLASARL